MLSVIPLPGSAGIPDDVIPDAMIGVWAPDGKCHDPTVTFTATTLQLARQSARKAVFWNSDSPDSNGAAAYDDDSHADRFEFIPEKAEVIHYPEGYEMGHGVVYKYCH